MGISNGQRFQNLLRKLREILRNLINFKKLKGMGKWNQQQKVKTISRRGIKVIARLGLII